MAETVDDRSGQENSHNAQDGHHSQDEELVGLGPTVLGWDLVQFGSLGRQRDAV